MLIPKTDSDISIIIDKLKTDEFNNTLAKQLQEEWDKKFSKNFRVSFKIYLNKDGSTSLDFKPNSSIAVKLLDFKKVTKNLIASLENKDINSLVSYIKRSIKPYFREEIKKYIQKMITGFPLKDLEEKNSPILLKDIDNEYLKLVLFSSWECNPDDKSNFNDEELTFLFEKEANLGVSVILNLLNLFKYDLNKRYLIFNPEEYPFGALPNYKVSELLKKFDTVLSKEETETMFKIYKNNNSELLIENSMYWDFELIKESVLLEVNLSNIGYELLYLKNFPKVVVSFNNEEILYNNGVVIEYLEKVIQSKNNGSIFINSEDKMQLQTLYELKVKNKLSKQSHLLDDFFKQNNQINHYLSVKHNQKYFLKY